MLEGAKRVGEELKEFLSEQFDCCFCDNDMHIGARTKYHYPDGDVIDIFLPSGGIQDPCNYRLTDLCETYGWIRTVCVDDVFSDKFYSYFCDYTLLNKCENMDVYFSRCFKNIFVVAQNTALKDLPDRINEFALFIQKFSNYVYEKEEEPKETKQ